MDPDFGVKASLRSSSRKSGCRLGADADSEIPELGLDSAHLNIDCDVNPIRAVGAAFRAAQDYNHHRQAHRGSPTTTKRKRTRLTLEREYDRSNGDDQSLQPNSDESSSTNADDDEDDDD